MTYKTIINLKEFKFKEGDNKFKEKNFKDYETYLKENHPFYKEFSVLNIQEIRKEFIKLKELHYNNYGFKEWFIISLIDCLNNGRSFESSLINSCLHTINLKSLQEYKILMITKDKESSF